MTIMIDLPIEIAEPLERKAAQEGQDVAGYVRQLAVTASEMQASAQKTVASRVPGLHAGKYWIAEDFDAPLPDSFWLMRKTRLLADLTFRRVAEENFY